MKEASQLHVLVTGGAGFLVSHLSERLLEEGQDVVWVDNFYTGSKRNIQHLLQNPFFELLRHDITFDMLGLAKRLKARPTAESLEIGSDTYQYERGALGLPICQN